MSIPDRLPEDLLLGIGDTTRIPRHEQVRQRKEAEEILRRLGTQPGVILADEVGMGKTYVALAVAIAVGRTERSGPVIVMVPGKLVDKWVRELSAFFELYVPGARALHLGQTAPSTHQSKADLRVGTARNAIELLRLLDDPPATRSQVIILASSAMQKRQTDKWVRLWFIAEALRKHGGRRGLAGVKAAAPRFLAELLEAQRETRTHRRGEELWVRLLASAPESWLEIYNSGVTDPGDRWADDPIPKALARVVAKINLDPVAVALERLPRRRSTDSGRMRDRLGEIRRVIKEAEAELWGEALRVMRWQSPLLVLDEAHHLKNPSTTLAMAFQELEDDLGKVGHGAFAGRFDRMLFLTATPFQLGHDELAKVLERFGNVRRERTDTIGWVAIDERLADLRRALDGAQRSGIALHRAWSRLAPADVAAVMAEGDDGGASARPEAVVRARAAFDSARASKQHAEELLRPWVVRHNKGRYWADGQTPRRARLEGRRIRYPNEDGGLLVPPGQTLPFFLAARSAAEVRKDLLGEALASSYDAFLNTRRNRIREVDAESEGPNEELSGTSTWYLAQFDVALQGREGLAHPKVAATVERVVDLWRRGEKVLVFAFYVETCRALRRYISREIERVVHREALARLAEAGQTLSDESLARLIDRVRDRYFDVEDAPGRRALDAALADITEPLTALGTEDASLVTDTHVVMRRFLRVQTSLLRYFPLAVMDTPYHEAVGHLLDARDLSGMSWRDKLSEFVCFLATNCSPTERRSLVDALLRVQTGGIRGELGSGEHGENSEGSEVFLPNVQVATGITTRDQRDRLMQCFNTPFFPEVLVCSEVMGEGVDLHRACRYVIHHDLAWNPSTLEQRTGRIDRLGCKAEGKHPIQVYMPYLAGMTDERQYKVMSDREQWFRVVMGQDQVAKLVTEDGPPMVALPDEMAEQLTFKLGVVE